MKIAILTTGFGYGGAERVAVALANWLSSKNVNVSLISIVKSEMPNYSYDSKLNFCINEEASNGGLKALLQRKRYVSMKLKEIQPDIIFSMFISCTILALPYRFFSPKKKKAKLIVSERNNPYVIYNKLTKLIVKFTSYFVDGYVFQTERVKKFFPNKIVKKGTVIHNPISNDLINDIKYIPFIKRKKIITAVGRLSEQKDYYTMIMAFEIIAREKPDYKLVIFGDGELKEKLISFAESLGLKDKIEFMGNKKDAIVTVSESMCYILSSKYEGMPNSLLEAMAVGTPSVSTNCDFGPADLINDGVNGYLVEPGDAEMMANKVIKILDSEETWKKISKKSLEILKDHSVDSCYESYYDYFNQVLER